MKITCPSNEHCNMCGLSFFCTAATTSRGMALLTVFPGLLFFAHRIAIDLPFHLCMRFFLF